MPIVKGEIEPMLKCLTIQPDNAILWNVGPRGQLRQYGPIPVPDLEGERGGFYGYGPGGWLYSYGLPNDMKPTKCIVLYRGKVKVGQMWFYQSKAIGPAKAVFVFRSMRKNADSKGEHMGHHDFCWYRVDTLDHTGRKEDNDAT